ncbi:MAG: hypothetical protein CVU94_00745 [Firmicutes bacterium HGW-Firmicutes-19]|nr:MAG: hypothetical protein CVU94_00745 [Firmicutes bacterium HGW-Firmicutes-19]
MGAKHTTRHLSIDLETYSSEDLQSVGLYKYCESPDFQVLLFAYSINGGEVEVLDLASGDSLDDDMIWMLTSPNVLKHAYNAQFERVCLSRHLGFQLPADQWRCTQVLASMHGLPGHLAEVGPALGITNEKHSYGKALIQYFSKPVTPTKVNHMRTRNLPHHDPDKWALFKDYCAQDVRAEMEIADRLNAQGIDLYTDDLNEQHLYTLDQIINDRGIRVQMDLVQNVINYHQHYTNELMESAKELTGLDNPKSNAQVKGWLAQRDVEVGSLNKESVEKLMEEDLDDDVSAMLNMRKELSKTSMAKYDTLYRATCNDGRIRGVLQYYGANRSGRWAGRLVQVQNLPRNYLKELDAVRQLVIKDDFESLNMIYDQLTDILSQLIRTTLIPGKGRKFAIADYSAIEARVIAWLANEPWRREVFAGHGKIYEASASQMFKIPLENITKDLRQSGKVAELACIAEGQLVLTDQGLVPIQHITLKHKVWDGQNFVRHQGLLYKGKKEVITYDGLTATPDHRVFVEGQQREIPFGDAASGIHRLHRPKTPRTSVRARGDHQCSTTLHETETQNPLRADKVPVLRLRTMDKLEQSSKRKNPRMPSMFKASTNSTMAGSATDCGQTTLREYKRSGISELRRPRDKIRVRERIAGGTLYVGEFSSHRPSAGAGQNRQRWSLRSWKYTLGASESKPRQSADNKNTGMVSGRLALRIHRCFKIYQGRQVEGRHTGVGKTGCCGKTQELATNRKMVRVYDILNAGPKHRFTVSGVLVHNCGYGGGPQALVSMGALKMGLLEQDLPGLIRKWRKANPNIVALWKNTEEAVIQAVMTGREVKLSDLHKQTPADLRFFVKNDNLYIVLPSGRKMVYRGIRVTESADGRFAIDYWGVNQTTRKWSLTRTYSGKLVENIIQGIARDCLAHTLLQLDEHLFTIVFHVHDEVICETDDPDNTVEKMKRIMAQEIPWAKGLTLKAEAYHSDYYVKD